MKLEDKLDNRFKGENSQDLDGIVEVEGIIEGQSVLSILKLKRLLKALFQIGIAMS